MYLYLEGSHILRHFPFMRYRAPEWNAITQHEWDKIGLKFESEGEFW